MAERGDRPLVGVDGPRPLPAALRARLEEQLLAGATLPDEARTRLSRRLRDTTAPLFEGVGDPRPMPAALRSRLTRTIVLAGVGDGVRKVPSGTRQRSSWLIAAAIATLLLASISVLNHQTAPSGPSGTAGASDDSRNDSASVMDTARDPAGPGPGPVEGRPDIGPRADAAIPGGRTTGGGGGLGLGGFAMRRSGGAPPFAFGDAELDADLSDMLSSPTGPAPSTTTTTTTTTTPPPPPPFRLHIVGGDPVEVAAFRAYVRLLNEQGGAGQRPFREVSAGQTADATVNLSGIGFAQTPAGISIDGLLATESSLRSNVFGFAGVPERQAHLIADAVFPEHAEVRAVIYKEPAGTGVLSDVVPDAIEQVLRERGVTSIVMTVEPGRPVVPVPAQAAFLSLTAEHAQGVVAAYGTTPAPARGFNGITTVAEAGLPTGSRFISPYNFPDTAESHALREGSGQPLTARSIHGWVTAKTLAVAVWHEDPRSPAALQGALERMSGYNNRFAPAQTYRTGTHAVQPDGVLFTVGDNGPVETGPFRTDPRERR
jgi:hypothetical protein